MINFSSIKFQLFILIEYYSKFILTGNVVGELLMPEFLEVSGILVKRARTTSSAKRASAGILKSVRTTVFDVGRPPKVFLRK